MNYLPLRAWFIVTLTLAMGAVIVRLAWAAVIYKNSVPSLVILFLLILAILGLYILLIYLTIKPSLKKLRSRPVGISVTLMATAGLISGIIHFTRFVPSPEAASPVSIIIASLLLMAGISAYLLVLWVIWFIRKA